MAATTIRELLVRLGVDNADAAVDAMDRFDGAINEAVQTAQKLVAGVAAVTASLAVLAVSAADAGDSVDKGSQAAAISTDAYQELSFVASQAGTDIELVTKALGKQTTALGQLEQGAGTAANALGDLGLGYSDLAGLTPDQQFQATAEAISKVGDEQERLRLATAIYGEEMAQRLLPMLNLGGEGIQALRDQAHDLGLVMSEDSVAAAVLFTDSLDALKGIVVGVKNAIGIALLPTLSDLISRIRDWYTANAQLVGQRVTEWANLLVAAVQTVVRWVEIADEAVTRVFGGWGPVLAGVAAAVGAVGAALVALAGLKVWFAIEAAIGVIGAIGLASFGAIIGAILQATLVIGALFLVIDDLVTYFQGGESALGTFLDRFREADGFLGAVARTIEALIPIGARLIDIVVQLGEVYWSVFSVTTLPAVMALGEALLWLAETALGGIAWWADNVVIPALGLVLQTLDAVSSAIGSVGGALGISVSGGGTAESNAAASSIFAPEAIPASGGGDSSTSVNVQGGSLTVNGAGITAEEAAALWQQMQESQNAQTAAALAGADL